MSESDENVSPTGNISSIEWNDQGLPISSSSRDPYFSLRNGFEESCYVFLEGNRLENRFSQLASNDQGQTTAPQYFTLGEIGFGTGLNFLSCWQLWQRCQKNATNTPRLTFISVEKYPLCADVLERSLVRWPELAELSKALVKAYKQTISPYLGAYKKLSQSPFYTLEFGNVRLILIINDAEIALKTCLNNNFLINSPNAVPPQQLKIDTWFLDDFTPPENPDMWSQGLFKAMYTLSHNKTTLATCTAASYVSKGLIEAGFTIGKRKGFGKKREMLVAHVVNKEVNDSKDSKNNNDSEDSENNNDSEDSEKSINASTTSPKKIKSKKNQTPWAVNRHHRSINAGDTVAIIGGGLAGCHTAYSLAKRNIKTTLIDANNTLASEASGNPQGIVYGKLSAHEQILSDFNLSSLLYAQQHYADFWKAHPQAGKACGVLQLSRTARAQEQHALIGQQFNGSDFLHHLSAKEASNIAGVNIDYPALFFPHCGWLAPQTLCEWLTSSSHITRVNNTCVKTLTKTGSQWQLCGIQKQPDSTADNNKIDSGTDNETQWQHRFDYVIIANANAANQFSLTQWLPTKPVRGQITYVPSQNKLTLLNTVICSEGYIAPSTNINGQAQHAIGASYNLNDLNPELSDQDHSDNLQQLNQALSPLLAKTSGKTITANGGRVGFRCTTPDYLPLAGPAPNRAAFKKDYSALIKNAHIVIPTAGDYYQGLYLNIGHGSRGLAYTPLTSEILACTLTGEPLPVSQTMANTLNPARFIIRGLCRTNIPKKNKT
jgi:tRNA 5-methylaminomethyl-2-thiouridine biosynthesis bifunctional protein